MSQVSAFQKLLRPILLRVRLMIARGVLVLVNDSLKMQEVQVKALAGEVIDGAEHWQPYGFTYHPHPGAEPLLVFPKGDRSHAICIAIADRRYRIKDLGQGEVAFYTDEDQLDGGHRIHFKRGQEIEMLAGASSIVMGPAGVVITTPSFDLNETA